MAPRKRQRADAASASSVPAERVTVDAQETLLHDSRNQMLQMWREGSMCDATVSVEGRDFECHRLVKKNPTSSTWVNPGFHGVG